MKAERSAAAAAALGAIVVSLLGLGAAAQTSPSPSAPPSASAPSAPSAASAPSAPQTLVAAREFYSQPVISGAALSPSGRWIALKVLAQGHVGLAVFDPQEWKLQGIVAIYRDSDVGQFGWVDDQRLVFDLQDNQRGAGEQRWWPGLFSVDRDGGNPRQLVNMVKPFVTDTPFRRNDPLEPWHTWRGTPNDGSGDVIIAEHLWDVAREFRGYEVKRLNVRTGRTTTIALGAPGNVRNWLFNARGEPKLVVTRSEGRGAYFWRDAAGKDWRRIAEFSWLNAPFIPRFVGAQGDLYVSQTDGTGAQVLRRFDFATGRPRAEALVSTPGFDFSGEVVSETPGSRTLGVRVVTDAETTVWFDPKMTALQKAADTRLPGHINRIACRRCGEPDMVAVIHSFNDRDPGQYWYHEANSGAWKKLGHARPGVDPMRMAATDFERIKARDGFEIPLWITKPAVAAPAAASSGGTKPPAAPAVLLVHGGPWVRGRQWDWQADAQFLASRGYVVLEPEFRGSTGYGRALYRAGFRQWGQAMQDDLIDALDWAVKQGLVDESRVCIAGASYGGYAALMGLVRHGGRFRCAAAWLAVTDPRLLFQWRADYDVGTEGREHTYPDLIGDPVKDAAMLDANTPLLHAARIDKPLLLAYGGGDRRVPLVHGERMKKALEAAGRPPEWVLYADEGHGWNKLETRLDFAARLEAFLARHLQ